MIVSHILFLDRYTVEPHLKTTPILRPPRYWDRFLTVPNFSFYFMTKSNPGMETTLVLRPPPYWDHFFGSQMEKSLLYWDHPVSFTKWKTGFLWGTSSHVATSFERTGKFLFFSLNNVQKTLYTLLSLLSLNNCHWTVVTEQLSEARFRGWRSKWWIARHENLCGRIAKQPVDRTERYMSKICTRA